MDPEGFPDFRLILEEACKEQLKEVLPENLLEPLQKGFSELFRLCQTCLLYTSPSPRDGIGSRMPSSA